MADNNISFSFPFLPTLTLLFIGLKLTNFIAWSWWWVLAPMWIPWIPNAIALFILLCVIIVRIFAH